MKSSPSVQCRARPFAVVLVGYRHGESRALADLALYLDLAPQKLGKFFHDIKPDPDAAVSPRLRAVYLPEPLKDHREMLVGDPDSSVRNRELHQLAAIVATRRYAVWARRGFFLLRAAFRLPPTASFGSIEISGGYGHGAPVGKLDGVVDEIMQDVLELLRIRIDSGEVRGIVPDQL